MTPADYCDAMARWWRDASAGDPPFAYEDTKTTARAAFNEEWMPDEYDGTSANEHHAAAWDRAAARLRANNLHTAADAAEES